MIDRHMEMRVMSATKSELNIATSFTRHYKCISGLKLDTLIMLKS